jgi:hypothetical protein
LTTSYINLTSAGKPSDPELGTAQPQLVSLSSSQAYFSPKRDYCRVSKFCLGSKVTKKLGFKSKTNVWAEKGGMFQKLS